MSEQPGPLETASDEELVDELKRRFRSFILAAAREAYGPANEDSTETFMTYRGGVAECLGLARFSERRIYDGYFAEKTDEPD